MNATVDVQDARILELEWTVVDERTRAEAARDDQRIRARLARIVEEIWDRAVGILADTIILMKEVIDAVKSPIHAGTLEEEPFEEDPEEEIQASGSDAN